MPGDPLTPYNEFQGEVNAREEAGAKQAGSCGQAVSSTKAIRTQSSAARHGNAAPVASSIIGEGFIREQNTAVTPPERAH